jgi:hypothetical protein
MNFGSESFRKNTSLENPEKIELEIQIKAFRMVELQL